MATVFRLPSLGSGLKEARIAAWKVKVGDPIEAGAPLCEIETEKSLIEIPSPHTGVIARLGAQAEAQLRVGDVLVEIERPRVRSMDLAPAADSASQSAVQPSSAQLHSGRRALVRAMPGIRRLARECNVPLQELTGTGSLGRVRRADVMAASGRRAKPNLGSAPQPPEERVRLSMHRRAIADHMVRSWTTIPHVFARVEVDIGKLLETRRALAQELQADVPLEALVIPAALPLLKAHPEFNATLDGEELVLHRHYDIGIAVNTPHGLVVPVLRDAADFGLAKLAAALCVLIERASLRKTAPEELRRPTFTVNNLGALGLASATSIIPFGTTAILSVGRGIERPVWRNGRIGAAVVSEVTLSFDHRVIDGGLAQHFLKGIQENLERPLKVGT